MLALHHQACLQEGKLGDRLGYLLCYRSLFVDRPEDAPKPFSQILLYDFLDYIHIQSRSRMNIPLYPKKKKKLMTEVIKLFLVA